MISLLLASHCTRSVAPDKTTALLFLSLSMWLFLFVFSCRKASLLVFRSFLERVVLYVVAVLVCLWEEVSSGSSYAPLSNLLFVKF